jgi:hypothetical protein
MQLTSKNIKTFNEWYSELPSNKQGGLREVIMKTLGVQRAAFYHFKNGLRKLSPAEKQAIDNIAGEQLVYPDDEDITVNSNLVKA